MRTESRLHKAKSVLIFKNTIGTLDISENSQNNTRRMKVIKEKSFR